MKLSTKPMIPPYQTMSPCDARPAPVSLDEIQRWVDEHEECHDVVCTVGARAVATRFGGQVKGYWAADNPAAVVGSAEGGHDFAVVGERWLVDPWLQHTAGALDRAVFDLWDLADRLIVNKMYGDEPKWDYVGLKGRSHGHPS